MIQSEEKPYRCQICLASFTQTSDLKKHSMIHSGEKPYTCELSSPTFTFTKSGGQATHSRIHIGENSYKCEVCLVIFAQFIHLKLHSGILKVRRNHIDVKYILFHSLKKVTLNNTQ